MLMVCGTLRRHHLMAARRSWDVAAPSPYGRPPFLAVILQYSKNFWVPNLIYSGILFWRRAGGKEKAPMVGTRSSPTAMTTGEPKGGKAF